MTISNKKFEKLLLLTVLMEFLVGCAGLDLLAAGQTDRLKGAPFYKTYSKKIAGNNNSVAHLGVGFDEKMSEEFFYAGRENALQPLADIMTAYLDSLEWSSPADASALPRKGEPYVYVGSSEGETAPPGSEMQRESFDKYPPMIIYIQKPSKEWRTPLAQVLEGEAKEYLLFISIGFCEYPKHDKGFFEKKWYWEPGMRKASNFSAPKINRWRYCR